MLAGASLGIEVADMSGAVGILRRLRAHRSATRRMVANRDTLDAVSTLQEAAIVPSWAYCTIFALSQARCQRARKMRFGSQSRWAPGRKTSGV